MAGDAYTGEHARPLEEQLATYAKVNVKKLQDEQKKPRKKRAAQHNHGRRRDQLCVVPGVRESEEYAPLKAS